MGIDLPDGHDATVAGLAPDRPGGIPAGATRSASEAGGSTYAP